MVLLGDEAQVEARFDLFVDSTNLDSRQVHGLRQRTIGSEIILDVPNGTPRGRGSSGSLFCSVWR
jgi:hypothetical protein